MSMLSPTERKTVIAQLTQEAAQEFSDRLEDFLPELVPRSNVAWESPIEELFVIAWEAIRLIEAFVCVANDLPVRAWPRPVPQHRVLCAGREYRLDFAFPDEQLAVECDGHAFHEQTPEQVERRNERDLDLWDKGWVVLHFSGRQLTRKPYECASRVSETLCNIWSGRAVNREATRA